MFYLFAFCVLLLKNEIHITSGANILALMGVPSPSHHIWNSVLTHRLAELGHNVTVLSADLPKPNEKLPPSLHYIHLEEAYSVYKSQSEIKFDVTAYINIGHFESIPMFYDVGITFCTSVFMSKGIQVLLNYPDDFKFDLIMFDYTLGPYLLGFMHKFNNPPLVGMSAFLNPPNTIDLMSNHYFPAYVPYHSTTYIAEMNFWQRLENTLIFICDTVYRRLIFLPKIEAHVRRYFPKDMPSLAEVSKRTAISLVNSHPAINYVESFPPNVIEVGGMQILDPKPLPVDLEEFVNKSRKGAVFISFGTNMKSEDFTEDQVNVIMGAMSQLPEYNFMWKFDPQYLKKKASENVLVRQFFPQRDLLAHPRLKAFVTHCGCLSSQESTWRGVPMVGVPLCFDQHRNLRQSLEAGIAVKLDFATMTSDDLRDAIIKVTEDPKMRANVKAKANQFRDRPMKPLDTAVWWVEYLLRNPNPDHLRSPAAKLNIFQANSLDCLLVIWTVLVLLTYITVKILLFAWRNLNQRKKAQNATKLKTK